MLFEEILFPSLFIAKKKYTGVVYDHIDKPVYDTINSNK